MATASSKEDLTFIQLLQDKYLECALCCDTYKQPKSLLCLHTYCEPCLEDYVKHNPGDIACPTCRKVEVLPQVGVSGLENNFLIKSINDDASLFKDKKLKCNNCEDDQIAVMVCIECTSYFCTACYKMHQGVKLIRESHNTLEVEKLSDVLNLQEFQKNRFSVCETHREPMKLFCRTEHKQLCHTCAFTSAHRGHDLCSIQEELDSLTEKIGNKLNQLSQYAAKVNVENDKLKNYIDESKKSKNKSIEEIEAEKKTAIAQLEKQYESMKEEIVKSVDEAIVRFKEKINKNNSMITLVNDQRVEQNTLALIPISESVMAARGILGNIQSVAKNIDEENGTSVNDIKVKKFKKIPQVERAFMFGAVHTFIYGHPETDNKVTPSKSSAFEAKSEQTNRGVPVPVVRGRQTVRNEAPLREGDIVMRGPDWKVGQLEDGGLGGTGKVVHGSKPDLYYTSVEVQWDTGIKHKYYYGGLSDSYVLQRVLT